MLQQLIDAIVQFDMSKEPRMTEFNEQDDQDYLNYLAMCAYENELRLKGKSFIAGIDEAGRGPLAGPVVAACVILPEDFYLAGLTDSKKLTKKKRESYFTAIYEQALAVGVGVASVEEIDALNILEATKLAMRRAVANSAIQPDHLLIDALTLQDIDIPQTGIIKGDALSVSIAAASVIAKVTRDRMMEELDERYPEYGFKKHNGYGTKQHREAIERFGVTKAHRKSFEPIKSMVTKQPTLFDF